MAAKDVKFGANARERMIRGVDILAIQEVRAATEDLETLLGPEWNILHDAATAKGRAGVALASRGAASIHRVELGATDFDSAAIAFRFSET